MCLKWANSRNKKLNSKIRFDFFTDQELKFVLQRSSFEKFCYEIEDVIQFLNSPTWIFLELCLYKHWCRMLNLAVFDELPKKFFF